MRAAHAALTLPLTAVRRHALRVLSDDVPALLTDMGLVAWCASDQDAGVFIAFDQHALGAMVEVQTIGRVLGRACHGRRATQTDFALTIPFIDAILDDAVTNDLVQARFGRKIWVQTVSDISHFSEREFDIVSMSFRMCDGGGVWQGGDRFANPTDNRIANPWSRNCQGMSPNIRVTGANVSRIGAH
jgi:hypothetical protein